MLQTTLSPMTASGGLARRAVILGVLLAAGCRTTPAQEPTSTLTAPALTPTTAPSTSPPDEESASAATPMPEPTALVSREEIIERYAGRVAQEWGTEVTGVVSTIADLEMSTPSVSGQVALTFDACGGGGAGDGYDATLIDLLRRHEVPATLFLNSRWIRIHGALAAELAADPLFQVACHGTRHVPLSVSGRDAYGIRGSASVGEVYDELTANLSWFEEHTGRVQPFTRPGTAHCDEVAAAIARDLGMPIAGFSVNGDGGATFSSRMVRDTLLQLREGDIVLAHMNRPDGGTAAGCAEAIPALLDRGVRFGALPVTERL